MHVDRRGCRFSHLIPWGNDLVSVAGFSLKATIQDQVISIAFDAVGLYDFARGGRHIADGDFFYF
jgi:hypothetical protein